MKNIYKILWSEEAILGLKGIISYLEFRFSEKDIKKFVHQFDYQINLITTQPELFPISSNSSNIRRTLVGKLTSIYFRIENDTINIISIRDNRQKPI
jgi:plasmid stabilization system protein ParE